MIGNYPYIPSGTHCPWDEPEPMSYEEMLAHVWDGYPELEDMDTDTTDVEGIFLSYVCDQMDNDFEFAGYLDEDNEREPIYCIV